MADSKKRKNKGAAHSSEVEASQKSSAETLEETESELEAAKEAAVEREENAHPPHGAGVHTHKPNIKEYLVIFAVLAALTLLEVVVAQMPGISRKLIGVALVGLALTKAAIVGLYYMHLKHETRILKLTVAIPIAAPTIYALVLITEAAWRLTRW